MAQTNQDEMVIFTRTFDFRHRDIRRRRARSETGPSGKLFIYRP